MAKAVGARGRLAARPGFGAALSAGTRERLVQPLLLYSAGEEERRAIPMIPGQYLLSLTEAVREARLAARAGIAGVLLLAAPDRHDESAMLAAQTDWLVPRAVRAIKDAVPDLGVATDVCVCAYTAHGQCVLFDEGGADVAATHLRLGEIAVAHAQAGADLLIVSGMLAGSVAAVRAALSEAEATDVAVAAAIKYKSLLFEPYRAAVGISPGRDRAVPLLALGELDGAVKRAGLDVGDGADAVAVMPGLLALDVVSALAARPDVPVVCFHVAGEYAMVRGVAESGLDADSIAVESVVASRRAGADLVISYASLVVAETLAQDPLA
jgi:porphobilinogen synthase